MEGKKLEVGSVVYSRKGHDSGSYYAVVGLIDEQFVLIADGAARKAEKPKKKKIKHLKFFGERLEGWDARAEKGLPLTDKFLKTALKPYQDK